MKILTLAFTKVTPISIHQLSSYISYKRCHMTFVQVDEYNLPIKNKSVRDPCSTVIGYIQGY
jgi:hypothetical protein